MPIAVGAGGGAAIGARHVRGEVRGDASPAQLELRGDAFHGDFGIWPIIWSVPVATDAVALTFDDGPDPEFTPAVLDALARYDAKATFMMMGWNAVQHPDLVHRVVDAGHEVGNHSWSHLDLAKIDPSEAAIELRRGREAVEQVSGKDLRCFRPPRGELSGAAVRYAASAEQSILMWTINGGAHAERTSEQIQHQLLADIKPGFIVDFHDGIGRGTFDRNAPFARDLVRQRHLEVSALPSVLATLSERGVAMLTVGELLAQPRRGAGG